MHGRSEDRERHPLRGEPLSRQGPTRRLTENSVRYEVLRALATGSAERLQCPGVHHSLGAGSLLVITGIDALDPVAVLALRAWSDRVGLELLFDRCRSHALMCREVKRPRSADVRRGHRGTRIRYGTSAQPRR